MTSLPPLAQATESMSLVVAENLCVGHGGTALLPPLRFTIEGGQFWALVGRNGSGKTTLLRTLLGLLPSIRGDVRWRDRGATAYIGQRSAWSAGVPARVTDLLLQGRERGWSFLDPSIGMGWRQAVREALAQVDLQGFEGRQFSTLSEGQKQRVLLARALMGTPSLLVLDEPTSAMDMGGETTMFALLTKLSRERQMGVLVVGHHLSVLAAHATHLLVVDADDRLAVAGPIAEVAAMAAVQERFGRLLEKST